MNCLHWWHTAPDGMVSCAACGKVNTPGITSAQLSALARKAYSRVPDLMPSLDVLFGRAARKECECGARKTGVADFKAGHSSWCPVAEVLP